IVATKRLTVLLLSPTRRARSITPSSGVPGLKARRRRYAFSSEAFRFEEERGFMGLVGEDLLRFEARGMVRQRRKTSQRGFLAHGVRRSVIVALLLAFTLGASANAQAEASSASDGEAETERSAPEPPEASAPGDRSASDSPTEPTEPTAADASADAAHPSADAAHPSADAARAPSDAARAPSELMGP